MSRKLHQRKHNRKVNENLKTMMKLAITERKAKKRKIKEESKLIYGLSRGQQVMSRFTKRCERQATSRVTRPCSARSSNSIRSQSFNFEQILA